DRMIGQTLDRLDSAVVAVERKRQTRAHRAAVGEHRARAADALVATALGSGEQKLIAQHGEQCVGCGRGRGQRPVIDFQRYGYGLRHATAFLADVISRTARASMRGIRSFRYSAVPRTSSTGFASDVKSSPARRTASAERPAESIRSASVDASGAGPQPPTATRASPSSASE